MFAQDFEMLPENAFEGLLNRTVDDGDGYIFTYAFYDLDNGKEALLLYGGSSLMDIYTIQDSIAVQQWTFGFTEESAARLRKNGTLSAHYITDENGFESVNDYYRFENGTLKLYNRIIAGFGIFFHIDADGNKISITEEEYVRFANEEYESGGGIAQLEWKPLAEYGR